MFVQDSNTYANAEEILNWLNDEIEYEIELMHTFEPDSSFGNGMDMGTINTLKRIRDFILRRLD